jgi:hypothetical protein
MADTAERRPRQEGGALDAANVNASITEALSVARSLAAAGIPVFVAYPDPDKPGDYKPRGRWQQTSANPAYVNAWRPGLALCAVMGHGLDLVDIDPRNGGDRKALNGFMPEVLAVAATPSGGEHNFVRSIGVRSRDDVLPGIDIKAGDPDGEGRGFAFIAPTVRVSKTPGVRAPTGGSSRPTWRGSPWRTGRVRSSPLSSASGELAGHPRATAPGGPTPTSTP